MNRPDPRINMLNEAYQVGVYVIVAMGSALKPNNLNVMSHDVDEVTVTILFWARKPTVAVTQTAPVIDSAISNYSKVLGRFPASFNLNT